MKPPSRKRTGNSINYKIPPAPFSKVGNYKKPPQRQRGIKKNIHESGLLRYEKKRMSQFEPAISNFEVFLFLLQHLPAGRRVRHSSARHSIFAVNWRSYTGEIYTYPLKHYRTSTPIHLDTADGSTTFSIIPSKAFLYIFTAWAVSPFISYAMPSL